MAVVFGYVKNSFATLFNSKFPCDAQSIMELFIIGSYQNRRKIGAALLFRSVHQVWCKILFQGQAQAPGWA